MSRARGTGDHPPHTAACGYRRVVQCLKRSTAQVAHRWSTGATAFVLFASLVASLLGSAAAPLSGSDGDGAELDHLEYCVTVGTLRAVASPAGPLVELVDLPNASQPPTITVSRPGLVGACAQLEVIWEHGFEAAVEARLGVSSRASGGPDTEVGHDSYERQSTGPRYESDELKVTAPVTGPGTHEFLATLQVGMGMDGPVATDAISVPFRAVVPDWLRTGAVAGWVGDEQGAPIAGATIGLWPLNQGPRELLTTWQRTATDARGRFWIETPPGRYRMEARAPWRVRHWFGNDTTGADSIDVSIGEVVVGNRAALRGGPPTDPLGRGIATVLRSAAPRLSVGARTAITYSLIHRAPLPGDEQSVVLLLDASASMLGEKGEAARRAAHSLVEGLHLADDPGSVVAIVEFDSEPRTLCSFTDDPAELGRCIAEHRAGGGTAIAAALEYARWLLLSRPPGTGERYEAVVLLSDGNNAAGCDPVLGSARELRRQGIQLASVCLDYKCDSDCLRQACSTPDDYYEARPHLHGEIESAMQSVARRLPLAVGLESAVVQVLMPEYLSFVPESASRPPVAYTSHSAHWVAEDLPPHSLDLSFELEAAADCPVVLEAITGARAKRGGAASYEAYVPATLPPPCVTPTPTASKSTPTTSATDATTAHENAIAFPILYRRRDK